MPKIELTCKYCGKEWTQVVMNQDDLENLKCILCGDSSVSARQIDETKRDVFGYDNQDPREDAYFPRRKY
jgi:hypothetical protein